MSSSDERPMVIAHRGSSIVAPEHTRAAYEAAITEGADAFECDVRLTSDGVPVCFHDATLDRVAGRPERIAAVPHDQLTEMDVGVGWRAAPASASLPPQPPTATTLLSFAEFLAIAGGADRPIGLRIELKRPAAGRDLLERRMIEALQQSRLLERETPQWWIAAMSFSVTSLRYLHRLAPRLPLVRLFERSPADDELAALPSWVGAVGPGVRLVRDDPTLPERIHRTGRVVNVWTVDRAEDVDLMVATGVDGIISNRPGFVLDRLRNGSASSYGAAGGQLR